MSDGNNDEARAVEVGSSEDESEFSGAAGEGVKSTQEEALRKTVHYIVGKISEEQEAKNEGPSASREAIAQISELTFQNASILFDDMRAFAKVSGMRLPRQTH
jgi:hypothetical protein